jgi:hypothetical protein
MLLVNSFLDSDPWLDITKFLSKPSRKPAVAAISYLGVNASSHLPLRAGDTLVCTASPAAIAPGATSVQAIRDFLDAGVEVFNAKRLHAKVIACGTTAWIGSANASDGSAGVLIEAAVRTSDKTVVADVRAMVKRLAAEHPQVDALALAAITPKRKVSTSQSFPPADWAIGRAPMDLPRDLRSLHLVEHELYEWSDEEWAAYAVHLPVAIARQHRSTAAARVDAITWAGDRIPIGEWGCLVDDNEVCAPFQVFDYSPTHDGELAWLYQLTGVKKKIPRRVFDKRVALLKLKLIEHENRLTGRTVGELLDAFRLPGDPAASQ